MEGFVIMEVGYEYDDNIYESVGYSSPQKIFLSQEDVENEIQLRSMKKIKEIDPVHFSYGIEGLFNCPVTEIDSFNQGLLEKYGPDPKKSAFDSAYKLHTRANDEETKYFLKQLKLHFFEFIKLEIDANSSRDYQLKQIIN